MWRTNSVAKLSKYRKKYNNKSMFLNKGLFIEIKFKDIMFQFRKPGKFQKQKLNSMLATVVEDMGYSGQENGQSRDIKEQCMLTKFIIKTNIELEQYKCLILKITLLNRKEKELLMLMNKEQNQFQFKRREW